MDEWVKKMPHTHTQSKCPSMDEWVKKTSHTHREEYYSAIKKLSLAICDNINRSWGHYAK